MAHRPVASNRAPWRAHVLTLFPEMYPGPLGMSLAGQALDAGIWQLTTTQIRDYGIGRHAQVDDSPAGGGAGMVMRADVLASAIDDVRPGLPDGIALIYPSPRGRPFTQALAHDLAARPGALFLAGRFEGIDERVIEGRALMEVSIGDYILSGGEIAVLAMLDATVRLLPGVVGQPESLAVESFETGRLEAPHYTRPRVWEGRDIPPVLLSGDHGRIEAWREARAREITAERRPDLLPKNGDDSGRD